MVARSCSGTVTSSAPGRRQIRLVTANASIGIVKAAAHELHRPVTIASVQTVSRPARLAQLGGFDLIVIDEAHHAVAESYRTILEALRAFETDGPLVLGVTATADRADGRGLADIFQAIGFEVGLLERIEQGFPANLRASQIRLAADFNDSILAPATSSSRRPRTRSSRPMRQQHALTAYQEHAPGRKALVFTSGVDLAHAMAAAFTEAGIVVAAVDGAMPLACATRRARALRAPRPSRPVQLRGIDRGLRPAGHRRHPHRPPDEQSSALSADGRSRHPAVARQRPLSDPRPASAR